MGKTIALLSILVLCVMLTAIFPSSMAATKGESTIEFGKNYTLSGTASAKWYIAVNPGDNITVNVSDAPAGSSAQIDIDTALIYTESSNDTLMNNSYVIPYGPMSFWFKCAYSQRISLTFMTAGAVSMTYNVTKVNGTNQALVDISRLKTDVATLNTTLAALNSTVANLTAAFLANLTAVNDTLAGLWNYTAYLNSSIGELNETLFNLNEWIHPLISDAYMELSRQSQNITWLWENLTRIGGDLDSLGLREMADYDSLAARLAALNASLLEAYGALRALVETNDTALRGLLEANNASLSGELSTIADLLADLGGEVQNISFPTPEQYNDTLLWKEISRMNATPLYNDTPLRTEIAGLKGDLSTLAATVNNTTVPSVTTVYINKTVEGKDSTAVAVVAGVVAGVIAGAVSAVAVNRRREYTP